MEINLLDTNVLIEILKGNQKTIDRVKDLNGILAISSISRMELYYGAFNKAEIEQIEKFTSLFEIIQINEAISLEATRLVKTFAKSHNLDIPDSLIAATTLLNNAGLLTYNIKDFRFITGLTLLHAPA